MHYPKVSILIPVYNREEFIGECIQSAQDQTYSNIEIIVVDNASSDKTWEICQEYASKDSRVRIFQNAENIGPVRNWRRCINEATGEYGKILWSDDLIAPDFVEKTLPLIQDQQVGFVYTGVEIFNKEQGSSSNCYFSGETGSYPSRQYIEGALLGGNYPVSPGCALFRLKDLKKNLLIDIPNKVGSDFAMHAIGNDLLLFLLTAQQYEKYVLVNEPMSYFRAHSKSITISESEGKVLLYYDLAKGYFAENFVNDKYFLKKINTIFWLHLRKYDARKYGIKSVHGFYPTTNPAGISLTFLMEKFFDKCQRGLLSQKYVGVE